MIIVRITSGLGNQMFQYNFYRLMKARYPDTVVKADVRWFYSNDDHHGYELERIFSHPQSEWSIDEASVSDIYKVTGQLPALIKGSLAKSIVFLEGPINRKLRERASFNKAGNIIDQLDGDISNRNIEKDGVLINPLYETVMNLDTTRDWYIIGFWIEERYYSKRLSEAKRDYVFPESVDENVHKLRSEILSRDSVSIHVRRGDYLSSLYSDMFVCLGENYYKKAVEVIRERVDSPFFYIFSDDPDWAQQSFDWLENKKVVTGNTGNASYIDMQLMASCKHNIIANSTFSQWGALLNRNEGHLTVYPSAYLTDEDTEEKTLNGWIRV